MTKGQSVTSTLKVTVDTSAITEAIAMVAELQLAIENVQRSIRGLENVDGVLVIGGASAKTDRIE